MSKVKFIGVNIMVWYLPAAYGTSRLHKGQMNRQFGPEHS